MLKDPCSNSHGTHFCLDCNQFLRHNLEAARHSGQGHKLAWFCAVHNCLERAAP